MGWTKHGKAFEHYAQPDEDECSECVEIADRALLNQAEPVSEEQSQQMAKDIADCVDEILAKFKKS